MARSLLFESTMKKMMMLMFLLIGCSTDPVAVHQDAHALWDSSAHPNYQYDIEAFSLSGARIDTVTVEAGAVVSTDGERTIDELLSDVEFQMGWEDCVVEVEYDPTFGYPQKVSVDCGQEGEGWTITRFEDR